MTRRAPRIWLTILLLLLAWALVAAPWIASVLDVTRALGRARTQDAMNVFPLLCLACSTIAVARGGPSRSPGLEPSMLAAVPLLIAGLGTLALAVPRYGLDALDDGVMPWALSLCALASLMLACGVRHTMRHAAWIPWVLAVPPLAITLADTWSSASQVVVASATLTASDTAPVWMQSGTVGFATWLTCMSLLLVSGGLDHGRRALYGIGLLVLSFASAWVQAAAWTLVGERGDVPIGIVRVLLLVAVTIILHRSLTRRGHARERWRHGLEVRPTYSRRYVVVAGIVLAGSLASAAWSSWSPGALRSARLAAVTSRPTLHFSGGATDAALREIALPRTREDRSEPQLPAPWDRLVLPLGTDLSSCQAPRVPWWLDVWDDPPIVVPFAVRGADAARAATTIDDRHVTWVVQLPAPGRGAAQAFEPIEQLRAHLARVTRYRHVRVAGTSATLLYMRHHGHPFAMVTTTQAVELPDGRHAYRSLVIATSALDGDLDEATPSQSLGYDVVNRLRPYRDRTSPVDANYAEAGRRAIDVFRHLIEAGRLDERRGGAALGDCDWRIAYDAVPRVERFD